MTMCVTGPTIKSTNAVFQDGELNWDNRKGGVAEATPEPFQER